MSFFRYPVVMLFAVVAMMPAQALNILLTNDDGYDHPWLRAVHASLTEAGHQVTLVAPAENQSGRSAALTLSRPRIDNPEPGIYAVHATPASSMLAGLNGILEERPDLIVSGTNEGANIGVLSAFSGTVGAVVAALHMAGEAIPGIAISANPIDTEGDVHSEKNLAHGRDVAAFLAKLVAHLETSRSEHDGLLPVGISLNVNYPAVASADVKGVGIYRHGRNLSALFARMSNAKQNDDEHQQAAPAADTTYAGHFPQSDQPSEVDGDIAALLDGYITIVPIDGDYTAANWQDVFPEQYFDDLVVH